MRKVEAVQNIAIRKIYKLPFDSASSLALTKAGIPSLIDRMKDLSLRYLEKSCQTHNLLTLDMVSRYLQFSGGGRVIKIPTFLCFVKEKVLELNSQSINSQNEQE